jgi:hypothetical protein
VGTKKYKGLELDERTVRGGGDSFGDGDESVEREGQRTRLGEKAAERKGSFSGRLISRLKP